MFDGVVDSRARDIRDLANLARFCGGYPRQRDETPSFVLFEAQILK
jgi:hypothetical protein